MQCHDFGHLPDGTAFIVMEYLKGETLSRRNRRMHDRMPLWDIVRLVRQVAAALAAAHAKNIVHRDLKPDKITPVEKWQSFFRRPSEKVAEVLVTHWLSAKNPKRSSKQDHDARHSG